MLEQGQGADRFDAFAAEVGRFLSFKQLPPPENAVFELVLLEARGKVDPHALWAVVNLADDPVTIEVPALRLRLQPGEGSCLPQQVVAAVVPPEGDTPHVLLMVRRPAQP
jgi:hypothetical protein